MKSLKDLKSKGINIVATEFRYLRPERIFRYNGKLLVKTRALEARRIYEIGTYGEFIKMNPSEIIGCFDIDLYFNSSQKEVTTFFPEKKKIKQITQHRQPNQ